MAGELSALVWMADDLELHDFLLADRVQEWQAQGLSTLVASKDGREVLRVQMAPHVSRFVETLFRVNGAAAELRARIDPERARASAEIHPALPPPREGHNTTHFSVVDGAGNAVSNTYMTDRWQFLGNMRVLPGGMTLMAVVMSRHYQLQTVHIGGCTMSPRTGSASGITDCGSAGGDSE